MPFDKMFSFSLLFFFKDIGRLLYFCLYKTPMKNGIKAIFMSYPFSISLVSNTKCYFYRVFCFIFIKIIFYSKIIANSSSDTYSPSETKISSIFPADFAKMVVSIFIASTTIRG